ncbi:RraA family protein [Amycolatopsis sp. YIM 10]|uniref:RraA family protein n=1 Tax=Amycolatopsis sp. YIM 10 TaxID=2653857 RepID=UPI0012901A05|nr:RraA family protein [Amycolatopsis sp. YIM 10]QFU88332.1 4-hydroxy-4-methyl-2-oxoglutarate aldolase [Amycolatopsis sp. YIM 10]
MTADVHSRLVGTVPIERVARFSVPRHDPALVARLLTVPDVTSAVADALDELGVGGAIPGHRLSRVAGAAAICGPAATLRYASLGGDVGSNRAERRGLVLGDRDLYGLAETGDIAVVDASAAGDFAVLGALSARWAALAGVAACVVDGTVRDTATLREVGLPIWSAGRNPACGRYRLEAVELNGPVTLSGLLVRPGDYLVADDDGVCVVPHDAFPRVVEHCLAGLSREQELVGLLGDAVNLTDLVRAVRGRQIAG